MNNVGYLVLGKLNRDTQILGTFQDQKDAESVALDAALVGMVSDTFVVKIVASFNEQEEVRARQQIDARTQSDPQKGVNADPAGPAPIRTEADDNGAGSGTEQSTTIVPASASGQPDTVLTAPSLQDQLDAAAKSK